MENIIFRELEIEDCDKMQEINPRHYIKNAWRLVDGKRTLVEIDYLEEGWPDGYERYHSELVNILKNFGKAYGAFDTNERMLGFVSLKKEHFGESAKYILLDSMFVTYEKRGLGIGRKLFNLCIDQCKQWKVDKIYICAGSAEDTIAFYRSQGCIDAIEINQELYAEDPRDMQLEFEI